MNKQEIAKAVVNRIVVDLCDRSGLQNEWDEIDESTRREIRAQWRAFVEAGIDKAAALGKGANDG